MIVKWINAAGQKCSMVASGDVLIVADEGSHLKVKTTSNFSRPDWRTGRVTRVRDGRKTR